MFNHRHDVLEQYDAISTNGSASLPAFVALASLELIRERAPGIRKAAQRIEQGFREVAGEFSDVVERAHGRGHLAGLKFRQVDDAKRFQQLLLADGLWTRVHAYHEGHRTVLAKLGLLADDAVVDFVLERLRKQLERGFGREGASA
jgi:acetylornithine/succinyldiaminopimelate/putrescine aminotransferase